MAQHPKQMAQICVAASFLWAFAAVWAQVPPKERGPAQTTGISKTSAPNNCAIQGEAELLRDALVSARYLYAHLPAEGASLNKKLYDESFHLVFTVDELLDLFRMMNDPASLRVFANLISYNIGEDPGERYDCIALEKGTALLPYFESMDKVQCSECEKQYGAGSEMCRNREAVVAHIKGLITKIKHGERCPEEASAALPHTASK